MSQPTQDHKSLLTGASRQPAAGPAKRGLRFISSSRAGRSSGLAAALSLGLLVLMTLWARVVPAYAQTPAPTPQDPAAQGAVLFAENCVVCHGPDGQGRVGATLAKDWPSIRPDLTVRSIIANGVSGSPMPAWSQAQGGPLTEAEIDALTAYILTWQTGSPTFVPRPTYTARPPITPLPQVQGDPNRGALLFADNCQVCHGPNGEGRVGATLAKAWSGVRPDLSVRTTISQGVPNGLMPAWSQQHGGPLSETDIDDLTAFVLTLGKTNPVVQVTEAVPPKSEAPSGPLTGILGLVVLIVTFGLIVWAARKIQKVV